MFFQENLRSYYKKQIYNYYHFLNWTSLFEFWANRCFKIVVVPNFMISLKKIWLVVCMATVALLNSKTRQHITKEGVSFMNSIDKSDFLKWISVSLENSWLFCTICINLTEPDFVEFLFDQFIYFRLHNLLDIPEYLLTSLYQNGESSL